jgi:phage terminase large subunit-like protein
LKTVLTKDFNIRETSTESWLHLDEIENDMTFTLEELRGMYAIGGADLSSTTDLTCATCMVVKGNMKYVLQKYFMPNTIERRSKEDRVPYDIWRDEGWIEECQDVRIDYSSVTQWFVDLRDKYGINTIWVGYDKWNASYWVDEMKAQGFNMEEVIQGPLTMSSPMKELEAELKAKRVNYNQSPILEWCLTNTTIKTDDNQNIRPVKGRNQRQRIDGTVSLIDAYTVYSRHVADYHAWNGEG